MKRISRRRFITISAAAAGLPVLPILPAAAGADRAHAAGLRVWRGTALGADALLQIHHPDPEAASRLIRRSLGEVERLERIFSLYRPDSALVRLNRDGQLMAPPTDLVTLLSSSIQFGQLTGGAFDVTIQPLWRLHAEHFSSTDPDPEGPGRAAIERALALVDYRSVEVDPARIRLARAGMAVTLNGIAQGYVTDRVVDLLREEGITSSLVDMGEIRAIGRRPDGNAWMAGLEDPTAPGRISEQIELPDQAIATSGGYGLQFDQAGRFNHLLDPCSGASAHDYLAVSVIASNATTADALSTAFMFMPMDQAARLVHALRIGARFVRSDGFRINQGSWG